MLASKSFIQQAVLRCYKVASVFIDIGYIFRSIAVEGRGNMARCCSQNFICTLNGIHTNRKTAGGGTVFTIAGYQLRFIVRTATVYIQIDGSVVVNSVLKVF